MRHTNTLAIGVLTFVLGTASASPASAEVHLTIQNGRVTLNAKDATLRQILAEWAKVGQTTIVNGDKVPQGSPLTLQLTDVAETQALDTVLRAIVGYAAQPRLELVANVSRFERIVVMPQAASATPMTTTSATAPPMFPQPGSAFQQPGQAVPDEPEEMTPPARGPVFNPFPQPMVANPQGGNPQNMQMPNPGVVNPAANPLYPPQPNTAGPPQPGAGFPMGVSVPGMIVPPPQTPGTGPGLPQPKRPGGGTF